MEDDKSPNAAPILLGRSFLKTAKTSIDMSNGILIMKFDCEIVKFTIFDDMKYPVDVHPISSVGVVDNASQEIIDFMGKNTFDKVDDLSQQIFNFYWNNKFNMIVGDSLKGIFKSLQLDDKGTNARVSTFTKLSPIYFLGSKEAKFGY